MIHHAPADSGAEPFRGRRLALTAMVPPGPRAVGNTTWAERSSWRRAWQRGSLEATAMITARIEVKQVKPGSAPWPLRELRETDLVGTVALNKDLGSRTRQLSKKCLFQTTLTFPQAYRHDASSAPPTSLLECASACPEDSFFFPTAARKLDNCACRRESETLRVR